MKSARRAAVGAILLGLLGLLGLLLWTELQPEPDSVSRRREVPRHVDNRNGPPRAEARAPAPETTRPGDEEPPAPASFKDRRQDVPAVVQIRVRVVDADGTPAAGASVRVMKSTPEGWTDPEPVAAARAGDDGRVRVRVPRAKTFRVHAERAGREGWAHGLDGDGPEAVIRLEELLAVEGRVVDQDGRPVVAAEVVLSLAGPITGPQSFSAAFVGLTDETGIVAIPRRPVHPTPYYRITARGYRTEWGELDRESLLRDGFEIRLERLVAVAGRFLDEEGRPVRDVLVLVLETMQAVRSGEDGRFLLPGLPRDGGTLVVSPQKRGGRVLEDVSPHGETTDLGDIRLGPGRSISGRVLAEDGSAAARGFCVWVRSERTGLPAGHDTLTGENGRFEITGLADGTYQLNFSVLEIQARGKTAPHAKLSGVPAGAEGVDLTLRRRPVLQVDLVSRETGRPVWVLRFEVRATPRDGGETIVSEVESRMRKRRVQTTMMILPRAGVYDVVVQTSEHAAQRFEVELGRDEHRVVAVELPGAD